MEAEGRPDVVDWGIVGENAALREINVQDPVDIERYWDTNNSIGAGLMVDDINSVEELIENAQGNGPVWGYTWAISGTGAGETGEFQGFVQFTPAEELRAKIEATGLYTFAPDVAVWEVSYAKYPRAGPHQVASAVRQACVWLNNELAGDGYYPRVAVIGASIPEVNPDSLRVLAGACLEPIASIAEEPKGIILYGDSEPGLDSIWLLNWNRLHHRLRQGATPELERRYKAV